MILTKFPIHKGKGARNMGVAKLSNSFSTGNGGGNFERYVQAVFLLALLADGFSPILERPIAQLDFQGKHLGYDTDDLIVTAEGKGAPKLLCQIKHDIAVTKSSGLFREVITAAWSDFQKRNFHPETDKIVLATGTITKDTTSALRYIYDQAISSGDESQFVQRIQQTNFTSNITREKFDVLKATLALANGGAEPSKKLIWQFCKSFVLLVFDLDFRSSVNQMLILSLIRCRSAADVKDVWSRLTEFAGVCNQSAASIKVDNIPDEIKDMFSVKAFHRLPTGFARPIIPSELWVQLALMGGWSEKNSHDIGLVEQITESAYDALRPTLLQLSSISPSYIICRDGTWKIINRMEILRLCEKCFSDQTVKRVFSAAKEVLKQRSNRFDQAGEFSPLIPEAGEFHNSATLRRGIINGLCILLNSGLDLSVCSRNICEECSYQLIRDFFVDCDWIRLAGMSEILPLVAEINPQQYLAELEAYVQKSGMELMSLFPQNGENSLFVPNFIQGVIWSVETLAWKADHLVSCVRCLGEIAKVALPDKDKSRVATDAIRDILLPWNPQTLASVQKQKNAVQSLRVDAPEIEWAVIMALLPGAATIAIGTQKPKYILDNIPEGRTVSDDDIWELSQYYASLAVNLADQDIQKLAELAEYIDYFDEQAIETYLTGISEYASKWDDEKKFPLWNKLSDLKYRILLDQKDAEPPKTQLYEMLCSAIEAITPQSQLVSCRRLYLSNFDEFILFEDEDVSDSWRKKEEKKQAVIESLYQAYGIEVLREFGVQVNNLYDVGNKLGQCIPADDMPDVFRATAVQTPPDLFLYSVISGFSESHGLQALSASGLQDCEAELTADILSHLRLTAELIDIAAKLLGEQQRIFWQKLTVPAILRSDDFDVQYVVNQLLEADRAVAAVNLCGHMYGGDLPVPAEKLSAMLRKASRTESTDRLDPHAVQALVRTLQNAAEPNMEDLSEIELIYLPWLDEYSPVRPRALICRLANDPDFFCELLQMYYKRRHEDVPAADTPKISSAWAQRLFKIFFKFRAIPGVDWDGVFHEDIFIDWLGKVKAWARENDRYEVAMQAVGSGLSYAPVGENGLLFEQTLCKTLNESDAEEIRTGYSLGIYNQRGAHFIDSEGKAERALAQKYNMAAEEAEKLGYSRYSELLRRIGKRYIFEAEQNALVEHRYEKEYDN